MASTPAPQPTSRTLRGRRRLRTRSKCKRQPRVVPWWPVPKARPASISTPTSLAPNARAVVRAMDEKAPGAHRRQSGERVGDPVALFREAEFDRPRRVLPGGDGDEIAKRVLVRREAEIGLDQPRLAAARPGLLGLEGGRGGLGRLETLDDEIGDGARALFVADEAQRMRGVVGGQAFEHRGPHGIASPACGRRWREARALIRRWRGPPSPAAREKFAAPTTLPHARHSRERTHRPASPSRR